MTRFSLALVVAFFLSTAASLQAQGLGGSYTLEGRDNVTLEIRQVTLVPPIYVAAVYVNGEIKENESMFIYPTTEGWVWENVQGNEGTVAQDDDGDLDVEVTTGPNTGKKTHWNRQ